MELKTQADYDKLETGLNTNENLKEKVKVKKAEKLKPRVIIYNVDETLENDKIAECLHAQNKPLYIVRPKSL